MKTYFQIIIFIVLLPFLGLSQKNNPQKIAQKKVIKYLNELFSDSKYNVRFYEFSDLIKVTPAEIVEVKNIQKEVANIPDYTPNKDSLISTYYDSIIKEKEHYIRENRIHTYFELDHFFIVKERLAKKELFHSTFYLYPDGKIMDVKNHLKMEISDNDFNAYFTYYKKYQISSLLSEKQSKDVYNYLKEIYEIEQVDKKAAMRTLLSIVQSYQQENDYDTTFIAQRIALNWLKENYYSGYTVQFSNVEPIKDSNEKVPIGYNIKVLIESNPDQAYYFEFDRDYILRGVLLIEPPFDHYFTKPNKK